MEMSLVLIPREQKSSLEARLWDYHGRRNWINVRNTTLKMKIQKRLQESRRLIGLRKWFCVKTPINTALKMANWQNTLAISSSEKIKSHLTRLSFIFCFWIRDFILSLFIRLRLLSAIDIWKYATNSYIPNIFMNIEQPGLFQSSRNASNM